MKLKTLAIAAAVVAAAPAFAEVTVGTRQVGPLGSSEFFLVVSDGVSKSFTYDTGFTFDQLLSATTAGQQVALSQTVSGAQWDLFRSAVGSSLTTGSQFAGVRWVFGTYDGFGTPEDQHHAVFTLNKSVAKFNLTNGQVADSYGNFAEPVGYANSTGTHPDTYVEDADGVLQPVTNNNGQSFNDASTASAVYKNSYMLLVAGLAAVGFMARRRAAR